MRSKSFGRWNGTWRRLGVLDPVDLPVAKLVVLARVAHHVERTAVVGQPKGPDVIRRRLRRGERAVRDEHGLAVLDADHQLVDDFGLLRVVAHAAGRLMEHRGELADVF